MSRRIWQLAKSLRFDGPSPGFWYANGRVFQIRLDIAPIFRLDLAAVEGGRDQRALLHFHIWPDMKAHRVIDPRLLWRRRTR